jgi:Lipocalin-like domain
MSAQLSKPDRPNFASGDWFTGTAEDYQSEASSYIAYSGPFHVDQTNQTLTHSMFVSLFPDWTGQTQPRRVKLDGDTPHESHPLATAAGAPQPKLRRCGLPWGEQCGVREPCSSSRSHQPAAGAVRRSRSSSKS